MSQDMYCLKYGCMNPPEKDSNYCAFHASHETAHSQASPPSALDSQIGNGSHYSSMAIQPAQFIHANSDRIGWLEGTAIEYLCRWRRKNGIEDLHKARHTIDLLIELEQSRPTIVQKTE